MKQVEGTDGVQPIEWPGFTRSAPLLPPGKIIGIVNDDWREFAAFKLKLCETRRFFPDGEALHWNQVRLCRTTWTLIAAGSDLLRI